MIDTPTHMILSAAEGYLELGMLDDARREFERLSSDDKKSIEAMTVLMGIHRASGDAVGLSMAAESLCVMDSDNVDRWIDFALVLSDENSVENARELLLEAVDRFPDTALVHFHLARLECRLGNLDQAKEHLGRSKKLCPVCRVLALTDEQDLQPIWTDHGTPKLKF
jgi:tetratricopeptide (TPR) repeat protein